MINKKLIQDLDPDVWQMAFRIFIKNASDEIPKLITSITEQNITEQKKWAHKLAGSSISVGLEEFSLQLKKIEHQEKHQPSAKTIAHTFNEIKKLAQSF